MSSWEEGFSQLSVPLRSSYKLSVPSPLILGLVVIEMLYLELSTH